MAHQLRVFVASSSEQISVAKAVAEVLKSPDFDVKVWDEEIFSFSASYIESLEKELEHADFAVVILTADDSGNVRRKKVNLPRDNVVFELGLFIGRLGRERCFFFVDRDSGTRIASDLSGVKPVAFDRRGGKKVPDSLKLTSQTLKVRIILALRKKSEFSTTKGWRQ
jgi:predicted nucleotide-binding protein